MYNKATVQLVGQCVLQLKNEKIGKSYETEFVVLKQECTPLFGSETIQQMSLITVRYENILLLSVKSSKKQHGLKIPLLNNMQICFRGLAISCNN